MTFNVDRMYCSGVFLVPSHSNTVQAIHSGIDEVKSSGRSGKKHKKEEEVGGRKEKHQDEEEEKRPGSPP